MLANGFLLAKLVTRSDDVAASAGASLPASLLTTTGAEPSSTSSVERNLVPAKPLGASLRPEATKAEVERKLVSLILTAPAQKLPSSFLDPATGLIKNNVQVACRRSTKRTFLCGIRPPVASAAGRSLIVRYRIARNGKGVFKWFGYKKATVDSTKF
jgi:hypothetical protein